MGLIKAAFSSIGTVLADQWKEYIYCDALDGDTLHSNYEISGIYMQDIFLSYRFSFGIILPILLPVTIFIILRVWSNCFSKRFTS